MWTKKNQKRKIIIKLKRRLVEADGHSKSGGNIEKVNKSSLAKYSFKKKFHKDFSPFIYFVRTLRQQLPKSLLKTFLFF